tara:strand:- start:1951 stop:2358 length:408 start_codon:yes stop_codon:yes gene_type:complete
VKNYYSILGVRENSDTREIKQAYRNLMRKWHPDVNRTGDATRRTEEVNEAYAVLSCPESRFNHDIQLREAGLSSKLLYRKRTIPCLECGAKGVKKVYEQSLKNNIKLWLGLSAPHKVIVCLNCCGTGWDRTIEEY